MTAEVDLVIRHGLILDGTGTEPFEGDIATDGGRIT
jgi:N-acyl-D-aspartate/D-glutamate deacylase